MLGYNGLGVSDANWMQQALAQAHNHPVVEYFSPSRAPRVQGGFDRAA